MVLQLPPQRFKDLLALVNQYNTTPEDDPVQRLFYLQKINYVLANTALNEDLYAWINESGEGSWQQHLETYNINPNASFFLKGIQFAQAIAATIKDKPAYDIEGIPANDREYPLLQERDVLLKEGAFATCRDQYIAVNLKLDALVHTDNRIKQLVEEHSLILKNVHVKLEAIKGKEQTEPLKAEDQVKIHVAYKTEELGNQVNNFNFKFEMGGWEKPFVFRVEDRPELGLEQKLHSYPVAKYFIEDFAVFMMQFKGEESPVEYKPVVLSQFANKGNLADVARRLQNKKPVHIASQTNFYFTQLADFCLKLIVAKAYHPDIKLTNFLVNDNLIRVSDRKTIVENGTPKAKDIRSSPLYAPEEYLKCISPQMTFNSNAYKTTINMEQFMAFQLGIALKEFLVLTQMNELPDDFRNPDRSAASYFTSPPRQIINLSLLVQELTRSEPEKRMTIAQFQELLVYHIREPEAFYRQVERVLPSSTLGLQEDLDEIKALLENDFSNDELLARSNIIFKKISDSDPKETRLTRVAEKLAKKCFLQCSKEYFHDCSKEIEQALPVANWNEAPWYRKLLYWVTFGYYDVDPVTDYTKVKIDRDLKGSEFQTHFPQLEFLPADELNYLGEAESLHFKDFIYDHVVQILEEESESKTSSDTSPAESGSEDTGPTLADSVKLDSGTIVISTIVIKDQEEPASLLENAGDLDAASVVVKDSPVASLADTGPLESGTIVVNEDAEKENGYPEALKRHSFFATPKPSAVPVKLKPELQKVDSVRTALFRGDWSNRRGNQFKRGALADVNWQPPGGEPNSELASPAP
ncbi:LegK7 family Dot/Icm T4SS effector kinase [Legionella shakespearei]|uniref:Protein kinase domain containing protein n=1 Tax=Legionella shakespearei DSM 23087 TaxID=1122169 RepID=A0A0W0YLL6_9GAMM|nr:LegK7 family Dot/Icm T4SS effector kinase [Legionella shakespearei]KTD57786.1 protein kinase domain containing protein [Legionella shakespearei DSM 23087]